MQEDPGNTPDEDPEGSIAAYQQNSPPQYDRLTAEMEVGPVQGGQLIYKLARTKYPLNSTGVANIPICFILVLI